MRRALSRDIASKWRITPIQCPRVSDTKTKDAAIGNLVSGSLNDVFEYDASEAPCISLPSRRLVSEPRAFPSLQWMAHHSNSGPLSE